MPKQTYTEKDIEQLSPREHVRLRTNIFFGNMTKGTYSIPIFSDEGIEFEDMEFIPAVFKAFDEIAENSIDEFAQLKQRNKLLTIDASPALGEYTITDNGRGIPIGKHPTVKGKFTPEVALANLASGRNFKKGKEAGVIGQNGVGSACTNFCSEEFYVDIRRDGKRYRQRFTNGAAKISRPSIRKGNGKTGTSISFQLDPKVFDDITLPEALLRNRAVEIALTNPGITVQYGKEKFKYKKGFDGFIDSLSDQYYKFSYEKIIDGQGVVMEFFVILDAYEGLDEMMFSYVNSVLLFDGGICNTQFMNAFVNRTVDHLQAKAKKAKCEVTKNDIRENLLVIGNLKLSDPDYDAQSKTRLTGPNLRKEMNDMIDEGWTGFTRKSKTWLVDVMERATIRHHNSANKKAVDDHKKKLNGRVPKLLDATSNDRSKTMLFITEGDSAKGKIAQVRDAKTMASLPLSGKINNVYGKTAAQVLNMPKVTGLLRAIGLVPGRRAVRSELRYGKVIIATDADTDGSDIFALLVNLFYRFWPELFDGDYEPLIYRMIAPNVCAKKGKQRRHFPSRAEYEKVRTKYQNWTITYYKGLGSMAKQDWEMILDNQDTFIPIIEDGHMADVLELLFDKDAGPRKEWLTNE